MQRAYLRDPDAIARWQRETYPAMARHAKRTQTEISFWDESGFRADAVHGKTWGARAHTPVVQVPGQRQGISAASAISSKGAFWFATYAGALTGTLFVDLLRLMMRGRRKSLHLILDGLPAHKAPAVKEYVAGLDGKLILHYLPGYAPDLDPDEMSWSGAMRSLPVMPARPCRRVSDWPIASPRNSPRWRAARTRPFVLQTSQCCPYCCLLSTALHRTDLLLAPHPSRRSISQHIGESWPSWALLFIAFCGSQNKHDKTDPRTR